MGDVMAVYDVRVWNDDRLIATAEDIVSCTGLGAVEKGIAAILRRKRPAPPEVCKLFKYLVDRTRGAQPPEGVRVFAARKPRGELVIG